ncbi:MAG TPA: hypothetical protein VIL18_14015 [Longimicrobiales bacterium]
MYHPAPRGEWRRHAQQIGTGADPECVGSARYSRVRRRVHAGPPVLAAVSAVHAVTALVAIIMTAVAVGAVVYRSKVPGARLESISVLMIAIYLIGLLIVYGRGD